MFLQKNSHDLALTLDNAKKLMMMGISKDLGKCKDVRRSDNRPCGNFVNRYKLNLTLVSNKSKKVAFAIIGHREFGFGHLGIWNSLQ